MDGYDHIRWRRLETQAERQRQSRRPSSAQPRNRREHARALSEGFSGALTELKAARSTIGIDPTRLLVLRFNIDPDLALDKAIDHLARIGFDVIFEELESHPIDPPEFCVAVRFETAAACEHFAAEGRHHAPGLVDARRVRQSNGDPYPDRLILVFAGRPQAKALVDNPDALARLKVIAQDKRRPQKMSSVTKRRLLVQAHDGDAIRTFNDEKARYEQGDVHRTELTPTQRRALFDFLDPPCALTPEDRRGSALREAGPAPDGTFYMDVDLWHPGPDPQARNDIASQLATVVRGSGGKVTAPLRPVADSYLIARVSGTQHTLDALLHYDRVARVDLPPKTDLPPVYGLAPDPSSVPDTPRVLPDDAPLACVVDSGVVSGHPLLAGLVEAEADIDSGEGTPVDRHGHGTFTAGAVTYGDIRACHSSRKWEPKVRLLSAKVLRASGAKDLGWEAAFPDVARAEEQVERAIRLFYEEHGCRVFNLSIGMPERPYTGGRQHPLALLLDQLANELNICIVVSAGNAKEPEPPAGNTEPEFQSGCLRALLSGGREIIDPGCAVNALTVGAIVRDVRPFREAHDAGLRSGLVAAETEGPSPMTRAGLLSNGGAVPARAVKPDLIAYGGNAVFEPVTGWREKDPALNELGLRADFQEEGLLCSARGTSIAAPQVTHACAIVEAEMKRLTGEPPTANLVRALVVHSAAPPTGLRDRLAAASVADVDRSLRRLVGYGLPNLGRALRSGPTRVVLFAQDELPRDTLHVYELDVPLELDHARSLKELRVTLAYDPPVRGTRQDYTLRKLTFDVFRGLDSVTVLDAAGDGETKLTSIAGRHRPDLTPVGAVVEWSTVQSRVVRKAERARLGGRAAEAGGDVRWHIVVEHARRPADTSEPRDATQRYALVVSLEHDDENVPIYEAVRERVEARERIRLRGRTP